ncbi:MAG TPA: alpha/beta hydrolase [Chitinophagaceae bacterium]|nr:alpha/beta hydrolase [Chitinophagaceae bacterium]
MASTQSKLLIALLKLINKKNFLSKQLANGKFDSYSSPEPPAKILRSCVIQKFQINNRNVFTLKPKNYNGGGKHILYLHGGAYVQRFNKFHWEFLAKLVKRTNCTITAPDYPLAPAHTYQKSFEMVSEVYRRLLAMNDPDQLIFLGDSAGGGFSLALAQKMRNEKVSQPAQIILLSPWLDISLKNPEIKDVDPNDPFLGKESLQQAGKLYAGGTNPDYYLLSPINGSLNNLGKISVFIGSNEILVADARKLRSLAENYGIDLNYREYPDMIHAWMFLNLPESRRAKKEIIDLIRS